MTKKYNLSSIMKRAWFIFRKFNNFSEALKMAWKEAKCLVRYMVEDKKNLKDRIIERLELLASDETMDTFHCYASVRDWQNYGKDRTYFKIVRTRDHSKMHQEFDYGYYDNILDEYVPGLHDARKGYSLKGDSRYPVIC